MFTSKREVDRHVSQSTKNLSENEVNFTKPLLRGVKFAKIP